MKSTALNFVILVSFALALIGCASEPAVRTTTTTETITKPLNKDGNGLTAAVH